MALNRNGKFVILFLSFPERLAICKNIKTKRAQNIYLRWKPIIGNKCKLRMWQYEIDVWMVT